MTVNLKTAYPHHTTLTTIPTPTCPPQSRIIPLRERPIELAIPGAVFFNSYWDGMGITAGLMIAYEMQGRQGEHSMSSEIGRAHV